MCSATANPAGGNANLICLDAAHATRLSAALLQLILRHPAWLGQVAGAARQNGIAAASEVSQKS